MSDVEWHLAQVNIGRARGAMTDPIMQGFASKLEEINALAERTPGFVWRLQTEDGDATAIRPYGDERIMINMSVWADLESLRSYVFRSPHAGVMRQRREWFEKFEGIYVARQHALRLQLQGAVRSWGAFPRSRAGALGRRLPGHVGGQARPTQRQTRRFQPDPENEVTWRERGRSNPAINTSSGGLTLARR